MSYLGSFLKRNRSKSPDPQAKEANDAQSGPILSDEDESFLRKVTSDDETPPELPPRPVKLLDESDVADKQSKWKKWDDWWASHNMPSRAEMSTAMTKTFQRKPKDQADAKEEVEDSVEKEESKGVEAGLKSDLEKRNVNRDGEEVKKEKRDLGQILKNLHLSSINNRVVGISKDTQKLLERFNQVLKDLVNGVPTAYDDLEKLLTEREDQLDKLYHSLPSFLQNLVKVVPTKAYEYFAPGLAATIGAGKAAQDADGKRKKSKRVPIPNLKDLIGKKGAVAAMLRSILGFLEARFPAFLTGTNVLMSLAVFLLLFVFWYCHKRGRETRLDRERSRETTEGERTDDDDDSLDELESQVNIQAVPRDPRDSQASRDQRDQRDDDIRRQVDSKAHDLERS